jgi:hypothetical protein
MRDTAQGQRFCRKSGILFLSSSYSFVLVADAFKLVFNASNTKLLAVKPIKLRLLSAMVAIIMRGVFSLAIRITRIITSSAVTTIIFVSNHFSLLLYFQNSVYFFALQLLKVRFYALFKFGAVLEKPPIIAGVCWIGDRRERRVAVIPQILQHSQAFTSVNVFVSVLVHSFSSISFVHFSNAFAIGGIATKQIKVAIRISTATIMSLTPLLFIRAV